VSITEKKLSTSKLSQSKEYREAFVAAFLKRYIPFQIRTIRKKKGMSQPALAQASKITQGVISRAEDPDYGNLTLNTVLKIASGFDLAFVGKFVRFSELLRVMDQLSEESLDLPSFLEECKQEPPAGVETKPDVSQPLVLEPDGIWEACVYSQQLTNMNSYGPSSAATSQYKTGTIAAAIRTPERSQPLTQSYERPNSQDPTGAIQTGIRLVPTTSLRKTSTLSQPAAA
jgi:transcriptional regulator with XRE-family HTH domain